MDPEILVSSPFTPEMKEAGEALVRELDGRHFLARAVFWLYFSEQHDWRLVIATPHVRLEGPKKLYRSLQKVLPKIQGSLKLSSIALLDTKDPLISLLSSAVHTGDGISGIRF